MTLPLPPGLRAPPAAESAWPAAPLSARAAVSQPPQQADFSATFDAVRQAGESPSGARTQAPRTQAAADPEAPSATPAETPHHPPRRDVADSPSSPDEQPRGTGKPAPSPTQKHARGAARDTDDHHDSTATADFLPSAPVPGMTPGSATPQPGPDAAAPADDAPAAAEGRAPHPAPRQAVPKDAAGPAAGGFEPDRHVVVTQAPPRTSAAATPDGTDSARAEKRIATSATATQPGAATTPTRDLLQPAPRLEATPTPAAPGDLPRANALAAALGLNGPGATASVPTPTWPSGTATVRLPLDHPQWPQAVAETLIAATGPDGGRVRLQLNPAHLGPVDIALDIDKDRARVQIFAAQPLTRAALQQAIPQLSALLAGQGLQLDHADVAAGHSRHGERRDHDTPSSASAITPDHAPPGISVRRTLVARGLIDDFA